MTESLKKLLAAANSGNEALEILKAHESELTQEDKVKIYQAATGKGELSEEELDTIAGGAWWNDVGDWLKKIKGKFIEISPTLFRF